MADLTLDLSEDEIVEEEGMARNGDSAFHQSSAQSRDR